VPKITDVRCIRTRATGTWLVVKVLTDQPGLYGIGSAHDYNATGAVVAAIEEWVAPRLIGRDASHIEDIWQSTYTSGYWRTGPTLNVALGGVDIALWDIKGKEAGMPVYQLLGGPCRSAVPCYAHASGETVEALEEDVRRYLEAGWPVVALPARAVRRRWLHSRPPGVASSECLASGQGLRRRDLRPERRSDVRPPAEAAWALDRSSPTTSTSTSGRTWRLLSRRFSSHIGSSF